MPLNVRIALKVNDLATSLAFYVDRLAFQLVENQLNADRAIILDPYDEPLLLAGPSLEDIRSHLDEPRIVYQPGHILDFVQENLDERLAILTAHGLTDADILHGQSEEGDRQLIIKAPDNYTILFVQQRSPEQTLAIYIRGGDDLDAALAGLTETDLDLTRSPEEWTIRQIVHHLAETDAMQLMMITTALAQSGSTFIRNTYDQNDQDHWVETLLFKERTIESSLLLFKAIRQHLTQLFQHIPDYWNRYILLKYPNSESEGFKVTVGDLMDGLNWHFAEHLAEIRETRRAHNR